MENLKKLHTHQYLQNGIALKNKGKLLDSGLFKAGICPLSMKILCYLNLFKKFLLFACFYTLLLLCNLFSQTNSFCVTYCINKSWESFFYNLYFTKVKERNNWNSFLFISTKNRPSILPQVGSFNGSRRYHWWT